jgi:acyl-CoA synthetase (AMP-forming)/AMP-acid ligase II
MLEAHFGVPASGAVLVALNTRLVRDEIAEILAHSRAHLLVVDTALGELGNAAAQDAGIERVLVCGPGAADDGPRSYEEFLAQAGDGQPEDRLTDEDDVISVNYTSGTTGRPKGVMYTHRGAYLNALAEPTTQGSTPARSTCGRCPCSTATAGATHGRSRLRRGRTSACGSSTRRASGSCSTRRASPTCAVRRPCC